MEHPSTSSLQDTLSQWVYAFGDNLFQWAYHKTGHKETAEDLVQETFLAALKSHAGFKGESSPKTWLFRILNNKITDFYRKTGSTLRTPATEAEKKAFAFTESLFNAADGWAPNGLETAWAESEHLLDNADFAQVLQHCLNNLPLHWKGAVTARYLLEKETPEICQELGITTSNYWQILHRAKLVLKKCIEVNWFQ